MVDADGMKAGGAGYRPHLDGIRAIAITLVLIAHFTRGCEPHGSGHVGVGLFFALSGYLITGLLLDEHNRSGRIRLFDFYCRRVGRLMPGLITMVVVTVVVIWLAGPHQPVARGAVAAIGYFTNLGDIRGWPTPFGQTWSLAIEEHFYLLWAPVLLVAVRRSGARGVLRVALLGAVVSASLRMGVAAATANWEWVARGTIVRGDALLAGCAAAGAVRVGWRPPRWYLPVGGALVLLVALWAPGEGQGRPVLLAQCLVLLSVGAAAFVASLDAHRGPVQKVLGLAPLRWLGSRSYSLYLWHISVLEVLGPRLPKLLVFAVTVAVSEVSYRLVEVPCRSAVREWLARRSARVGVRSYMRRLPQPL